MGKNEIFVQSFPDLGQGKWMVSSGSGIAPRWTRDGRCLLYLTEDHAIMAVEMQPGATFNPAVPRRVGELSLAFRISRVPYFRWDTSPDGSKFYGITETDNESASAAPITVVLNWTAALKK